MMTSSMKPRSAATKGLAKRVSYSLVRAAKLGTIENFGCALGTHHRDLGGRPRIIHVGADMFGGHDVIRAAIGLARDQRDHRHSALAVGEQEFCAVLDDAAIFLRSAGQEAGHIDQCEDRNVEGIAKAHEARSLARGIDVEAARQHHRLIGDDADAFALDADEAGEDVARVSFLNFKEVALIGQRMDEFAHVVRFVRIVGDERVEPHLHAIGIVVIGAYRRFLAIVERQEIEQVADALKRFHVVVVSAVRH